MLFGIDLIIVAISLLLLAAFAWCCIQIQSLNGRLTSLEKQHLALISELEESLYDLPGRS